MNRNFTKVGSIFFALCIMLLPSCTNNNTGEQKADQKPDTNKAAPPSASKKPYIVMGGFSAVPAFASFGDPANCMGKGICGVSLTMPNGVSNAPTISMYKQGATTGQSTLIILINPADINPPLQQGDFPPLTIGANPAKPLIIDKSVFNTPENITISSNTPVTFTPPGAMPFGVLSINF